MRVWIWILASALFTYLTRCPPGSVYSEEWDAACEFVSETPDPVRMCDSEKFWFAPHAALHTDPFGTLWNAVAWGAWCVVYAALWIFDTVVPLDFLKISTAAYYYSLADIQLCLVDHFIDAVSVLGIFFVLSMLKN